MLVLTFLMAITALGFSACAKTEPTLVATKGPKLKTFEVPKSEAETKELNIKYKVVKK